MRKSKEKPYLKLTEKPYLKTAVLIESTKTHFSE